MRFIRSRKALGGLALAATFALAGGVAVAQQGGGQGEGGEQKMGRHWGRKGGHGGRGHGLFGGRLAERLNLTDAQKQQMRQIAERHRESTKALREQAHAARGQRGAAFDGTFNEAEVRAAAQARANARVELEVAHARMMSEMFAVLTPEQKVQLAALRQEREQRRQERRQRRQAVRPNASQTE
jgi:periplasmic protein CpxP/Spy